MKKLLFAVLLTLVSTVSFAASNSSPGLYYGQVPTATQWNGYFTTKLDYRAGAANAVPYWDGSGNFLSALISGDCTSVANVFTCTSTGAAKWATARLLAGNSVDGSANVPFANAFIVKGTADSGLSGAQFLGALGTGILKNTTTSGTLSIAVAGDFPTLNQNTTGNAATATNATNATNQSGGTVAATTVSASGQITSTVSIGTAPFVVTSPTQVVNLNAATAALAGTTNGLNSATTTVFVGAATAPTNGQILTATSGTTATWQNPLGELSATSASIGGGALIAGACATTSTTMTGATVGEVVVSTPNTFPGAGNLWHSYVSAANTVVTEICAVIAATPTASTYNIRVFN